MPDVPFSRRHGYTGQPKEITVHEDAPENLRSYVLKLLKNLTVAWPAIVYDVLDENQPSFDARSYTDQIMAEAHVEGLLFGCKWFRFYEIVEQVCEHLRYADRERFSGKFNAFCIENGIGYQLVNGEVVMRGDEAFEAAFNNAAAELARAGLTTAAREIHDARRALSLRPEPSFRGAIFHGMGALECIARDITGKNQATLGEIIKGRPDLLPNPLDKALPQIWGYASNVARHVEQGVEPGRDEAELVVGLAAALATYLTRKYSGGQP